MERMLIVDDEIEILEWLEELFLYEYPREVEVHAVSSAYEALEILDQMAFHVILTDIRLWKDRNACQKIWSRCGNWGVGFAFSEKMLLFLLRLDTRWEYAPDDESFLEQCGDILKKRIPEWIRMEEVLLEHRFLLLFFQPTERDNHQWHRIFQVSKGAVENVQEMLCTGKEFFGGSFFSDFVSGKSQRAYFTDAQNHGWLYGGHEICHSGCGKNGNGI